MSLLAVHKVGVGALRADEPAVHADDEGFLRGRAVFETLRVYGGRPFQLDAHLERLRRSAASVRLPEPDLAGLAQAGTAAIADGRAPHGTLRFLWTPRRDVGGAPTGPALASTPPPLLEQRLARGRRRGLCGRIRKPAREPRLRPRGDAGSCHNDSCEHDGGEHPVEAARCAVFNPRWE